MYHADRLSQLLSVWLREWWVLSVGQLCQLVSVTVRHLTDLNSHILS